MPLDSWLKQTAQEYFIEQVMSQFTAVFPWTRPRFHCFCVFSMSTYFVIFHSCELVVLTRDVPDSD